MQLIAHVSEIGSQIPVETVNRNMRIHVPPAAAFDSN